MHLSSCRPARGKKQMKLIILILLIMSSWPQFSNGTVLDTKAKSQDNLRKGEENQQILKLDFGFLVWLVRDVPPYGSSTTRHLYYYMEPEYFSLSAVETVLTSLAREQRATSDLEISLYSDELIVRQISRQNGISGDSINAFVGREDREQTSLSRKGCYRAFYFRKPNGREWIEYTPDPNKEERVTVDLHPDPQRDLNIALTWAVRNGDLSLVRALVGRGAEVNALDENGMTPLMYQPKQHAPEVMKALIELGADPNRRGASQRTPLIYASISGGVDAVMLLIESGSEIDAREADGATALMNAAQLGHDAKVRLLLKLGANPNLVDNAGQTALMKAAKHVELPYWLALQESGKLTRPKANESAGSSPGLANNGSVEALLQAGAQVNAKDKKGQTALMLAVQQGNLPVIDRLLALGADPNIISSEGDTALRIARRRWPTWPDLVETLRQGGASK